MITDIFKPTRSYEIDQNLLEFLKTIYFGFKHNPDKEVKDISSLTQLAKAHNLSNPPSQNILYGVDWSVEPTIETAITVHRQMNEEKRVPKKKVAVEEPKKDAAPVVLPSAPVDGVKVIGKIDLGSINEKMHPDRKTSAEKKEMREEMEKDELIKRLRVRVNVLEGQLKQSDYNRNRLQKEIDHYKESGFGNVVTMDEEFEKQLEGVQDKLSEVMIDRNQLAQERITLKDEIERLTKELAAAKKNAVKEYESELKKDNARLYEIYAMLKDETQAFFKRYCDIVITAENGEAKELGTTEAAKS